MNRQDLEKAVFDSALEFVRIDRQRAISFKCAPEDAFAAYPVKRAFDKLTAVVTEYENHAICECCGQEKPQKSD